MSRSGPQPMPVADAICQPGRRIAYPMGFKGSKDTDEWGWSDAFRDAQLIRCKRVNFGTAPPLGDIIPKSLSRMCLDEVRFDDGQFEEIMHRLAEAIGPQLLPYDRLWLEGKWDDPCENLFQGVAVHAFEYVTNKGYRAMELSILTVNQRGIIVRHPALVGVRTDDNGMITSFHAMGYDDEEVPDRIVQWTLAAVMPAMWAIGMMNCKNVSTRDVERVPTKTKKQRRPRGRNLLDYSTIVLPGQVEAERRAARGEPEGLKRLHTVRGHFATYTAEAPLFGRHTGTYWRPWHLAGNPDAGVVESDYKIET